MTKKITLKHTTKAQILIVSPRSGSCMAAVPETVAAIIVWFLGSIPAMAAGVVIFKQVAAFRVWLRGWREDLALIWMVAMMTMRLEFA